MSLKTSSIHQAMIQSILVVALLIGVSGKTCECPINQPPTPGVITANSFTLASETFNDPDGAPYDYGKPVIIGKSVFHTRDFSVPPQSIFSVNVACPPGYRLPSIVEYQELLNTIGGDLYVELQKADGFKGEAGFGYISSTKSFAGKIYGNDPESYEFKGIQLDKNEKKVFIDSLNTLNNNANIKARCFLGTITYAEDIVKDFFYGVDTKVTITNPNTGGSLLHFGQTTTDTKQSDVKYKSLGCQLLQSWLRNAAGVIMYRCDIVWVDYRMGSNETTPLAAGLTPTKIATEFKPKSHMKMFNDFAIAPIAPKPKGGFYVAYSDDVDLYIHVAEYADDNTFGKKTKLTIKGHPLDICALSEGGFAIYVKSGIDSNYSFVTFFDSDYVETYLQVVMNNGLNPKYPPVQQISFYDSHKEPIYGFNLMSNPRNGRLIQGRGKVCLIFQHENDFDDSLLALGDSIVILDPKTEPTYSVPWVASPSLEQYLIYDGRYFITASLGNKSPQNIQICVSDMISVNRQYDDVNHQYLNNPGKCKTASSPLHSIPGDGIDNSCGRLGGIVNLKDKYAVVYTRKHCKANTDFLDDQLVLVTFTMRDMEIENISPHTITTTDIQNVMNVKIGKYGDKILIMLYMRPVTPPPQPSPPNLELPENEYTFTTETVGYIVADFDGTILNPTQTQTPPQTLTTHSISQEHMTNEPMKMLKKGNLIWTSIDKSTKKLNIFITPDPLQSAVVPDETPEKEVPIEEEDDFIHGNQSSTITLSLSTLLFLSATALLFLF